MSRHVFQDVMLRDGGAERVLREASGTARTHLTVGLTTGATESIPSADPPTVLHRSTSPTYADLPIAIERALELPPLDGWVTSFHHHFGLLVSGTARTDYYLHSPTRALHEPSRVPWELPHLGPELRAAMREREQSNLERARRILVNSGNTAQRVRSHYGVDPEVLHPPTDLWRLKRSAPRRPVPARFVLTVSRLSHSKSLLETAADVAEFGVPWVIVGDGDSSVRRELSSKAIVLGRVPATELSWLIENSSVCLSPGLEDFGLFAAEALTFGRPVVARVGSGVFDLNDLAPIGLFGRVEEVDVSVAEALEHAESQRKFDPTRVRRALDPSKFRNSLWKQKPLRPHRCMRANAPN